MIEVFKTNVQEHHEAQAVITVLRNCFPERRINIDLHDCDKVLRIEGKQFHCEQVIHAVREQGFTCAILDG
ncbi:MAG TPA: hypothetical protein VHK91_15475 [Flavisolibacter sp.]|jgi:hypothetical protein|nr:hypothetical protein [Flavisolibacter sp.]